MSDKIENREERLAFLVMDLLEYEAKAWATDSEVNGGDLVEFLGAWR